MKFQYFTFLLNPTEQGSFFPDKRSKVEILREILTAKEPIEYDSRGNKMAFLAEKQENDFIVGRFGKRSYIRRHLAPDTRFAEKKEEDWPFCYVIFNLSTDPEEGQRIAVEYKSWIFTSPAQVLKSFAKEVNTNLFSSGYALSINPITAEQEFWKIVDENKDKIERLSFTFNAPNLFQLGSSLEDELRDSQKEYALTKATMEFENPDGKLTVPHNKLMKEAVEYVARGGGEYRVKIKGAVRHVINSSKKILTRNFDDLEIITSDQKTLFSLIDRIFK